jgi:hypothetical protein
MVAAQQETEAFIASSFGTWEADGAPAEGAHAPGPRAEDTPVPAGPVA